VVSASSRRLLLVVAALALAGGCSDDAASPDATASAGSSPVVTAPDGSVPANPAPRVDLIADAVAALEQQLGGPQEYFEINATPRLVNLFVALNNGAVAQPWVYFDGVLTSQEGQAAQGNTFAAAALTFDPDTVLDGVVGELPTSVFDAFIVEGGQGGVVRYTVVVTSTAGGQLVVTVGPTGDVLAVDPV
jgi:hypothetical protein